MLAEPSVEKKREKSVTVSQFPKSNLPPILRDCEGHEIGMPPTARNAQQLATMTARAGLTFSTCFGIAEHMEHESTIFRYC